MSIQATCPGCGSSLTLEENAGEVVCQYCGTRFHVNLDNVNPTFQVGPPSPEETTPREEARPASQEVIDVTPRPADEVFNPPIPGQAPTPPGDFYNPPIPGQPPVAPNDLYNPPFPGAGSGQPPYQTPPQFNTSTFRTTFLTGNRLWLTLAIVAIIIFCSSCVCLLYAIQRVAR